MDNLMKNKKMLIGLLVGLYLVSSGVSWAAFSIFGGGSVGLKSKLSGLAGVREGIAELPKTEECPINGAMYTKPEREIWEDRRPLAAVIQNHPDSRPLSGLSKADIVYEAVAEGGVTRFLGIFYCGSAGYDLRIGVIRSARVHFVKWAAEYGEDPLFLHWGGANNFGPDGGPKPKGDVDPRVDAYGLLDKLGWRNGTKGNDLDGGFNLGYPAVVRDPDRLGTYQSAAEHTPVAFLDKIYEEADKRGFGPRGWDKSFEPWTFVDDSPLSSPKASKISFEFWSNKADFDVSWEYDASTNSYKRINGGKPFVDWEFDNEQVTSKNVVIQFIDEEGPVDRELHIYYELVGTGEALIFNNGDVIEATWEKESQFDRTVFYDENGDEVEFVRGNVWIEGVPTGNSIDY